MSLDKLAVIFIIIILPISIVFNAYTDYQTKTLNLQISYDNKLNNATRDALKAYQLNSFNESTSNLAVSKMRDIESAANTFFNSIATNFNMEGYNKETIQDYVPALVFTMYNGFYIYSRFENTLTEDEYKEKHKDEAGNWVEASTYQNGQMLYGLQPFVSYSCRYKMGSNYDFVISYSLDNYISIQGTIDGKWVNDAGYLIDYTKISFNNEYNNTYIVYRGHKIEKENILEENVGTKKYPYHKINGVKYYYDKEHVNGDGKQEPKWFSLINGTKVYTNAHYDIKYDYSAYNYYKSAYEFTKRIKDIYKLENLKIDNAYGIFETKDANGNIVINEKKIAGELNQDKNTKIFGNNFASGIEEPISNFNAHRLAVIKYTIEKYLSVAIKNYNHYSNVEADFQMPKLEESEWDKILNNVTLISFLQGMPIGGKVYNGCSVIANNKNDEVVTEQSLYIAPQNSSYYVSPLYRHFYPFIKLLGIFNVDLEKRTIESGDASIEPDNYYPKYYLADENSIMDRIWKC